jgi:hypothetical protein
MLPHYLIFNAPQTCLDLRDTNVPNGKVILKIEILGFSYSDAKNPHRNELLKVIDKSQADIDTAIAAIKASEIEGDTKDFAYPAFKWLFGYPRHLSNIKLETSGKINEFLNPERRWSTRRGCSTTNWI